MKNINNQRLLSPKVVKVNEYMSYLYDSLPRLYEALIDEEEDDVELMCKELSRKLSEINRNKYKLNE